MQIMADQDTCVGAGMCVLTAPDIFGQNESDGRVVLLVRTISEEARASAQDAVDSCPSGALTLVEPDPS